MTAVDPDFQNDGIGSELTDFSIARVSEAGRRRSGHAMWKVNMRSASMRTATLASRKSSNSTP